MKVDARDDLRAEVESVTRHLYDDLDRVLRDEIQEKAEARGLGFALDADLPRLVSGLSSRTLSHLWAAVLESSNAFFRAVQKTPAPLLKKLHLRLVEHLRDEGLHSFPPSPLENLRSAFTGVLAWDSGKLVHILRRVGLDGKNGATLAESSDRVSGLYDLFRGLVVHVLYEPSAPEGATAGILGFLPRGSLVLGECGAEPATLLDQVRRCGADGVFKLTGWGEFGACRVFEGAAEGASRIEDVDVDLPLDGLHLPARRIATLKDGKVVAVMTTVLDRSRLSAPDALSLASRRWRIDKLFTDLKSVVDLRKISAFDPLSMEAQVHSAALLGATLRAARGLIAARLGLPSEALAPEYVFPRVARQMGSSSGSLEILAEMPSRLPKPPEVPLDAKRRARLFPTQEDRFTWDEKPLAPRRRPPAPATREEMMAIGAREVEAAFAPFCDGYEKVGHRSRFLWPWVQRGLELTALPSIAAPFSRPNLTAKLLGVMLDVLLDDVADNFRYQDKAFLEALIAIPFSDRSAAPPPGSHHERYHEFAAVVWAEIQRLTAGFPRYEEFKDIWQFDYQQLLNTMRYAYLVNHFPEVLNPTEHDLYQPHNMHMMVSGTVDLMCSPGFDRQELSLVRQALWRGQVMGRIGNMVSTWEREIKEKDFTSGVFAAAIARGAVTAAEMPHMPAEDLTSAIEASGVVQHFLKEWERLRDEVYEIAAWVRSVDLLKYAAGLEELIRNHLGSRGLK